MEFVFKESSCVAVGTFNIYIIQPKMLAQMGIIESGMTVGIAADLTQPGIRFNIGNTRWTVRPERLAVESSDPAVDCGKLVADTLRCLCWTPIMAIGSNVAFTAEVEQRAFDQHFRPPNPDLNGTIQNTCHTTIQLEESRVNIQLSTTDDAIELLLNRHTDLKHCDNQVDANAAAIQAADSFMDHRSHAVDIAQSIITQGIFEYEPANAE